MSRHESCTNEPYKFICETQVFGPEQACACATGRRAIVQMQLPRSWRPYVGKWVPGSAFLAIALLYDVVEIFSGLFDVIVPLHIPAR
jgi:hypothetical protein